MQRNAVNNQRADLGPLVLLVNDPGAFEAARLEVLLAHQDVERTRQRQPDRFVTADLQNEAPVLRIRPQALGTLRN
jgi:hypothetical protein